MRSKPIDSFVGDGITNYLVHGGFSQLEKDGLLTIDDVPALTGSDTPPVLTAMTCVVGNFGLPDYESLATVLMKVSTGGAAALIAPSGLSVNREV